MIKERKIVRIVDHDYRKGKMTHLGRGIVISHIAESILLFNVYSFDRRRVEQHHAVDLTEVTKENADE